MNCMRGQQQARYYDLGRSHFWLRGKYELVADRVRALLCRSKHWSRPPRTLDAGCGPGNMLDILGQHGEVFGSDLSHEALEFCRGRGYRNVVEADLTALPFPDATMDLVTCIDCLEHVEDDLGAIQEIHRILRPGGFIVVTVPAFMCLWGPHDEIYGHQRRYRAREVSDKLASAGFARVHVRYFEALWFVPLLLMRKAKQLVGLRSSDDFVSLPKPLNAIASALIHGEGRVLERVPAPFGVTILASASKPTCRSSP